MAGFEEPSFHEFYSCKEINSADNIRELEVDFPQSNLQMRTNPANILTTVALWDSEQRNPLRHAQTSDLQKLWGNKLVVF